MIETKQISEYITGALNEFCEAKFKIFADIGDFQKSYRPFASNEITHYVNGILSAMTPDIVPIKNIQVATQTMQISFVFDIDLLGKDENGNYIEVEAVKKELTEWGMSINGKPFALADGESIVFEVTPTFEGITVGTASQLSPIGDILPVEFDIDFVMVEAGINSNSVSIYLNGENLFFQGLGITRTRVAETNMFAKDEASKTVIQSNGVDFAFEMPMLNTAQCLKIEQDILRGGLNNAQAVEYKRGEISKQYIMVFGDDGLSFEPALNIGLSFHMIEGKPNVLTYSEAWRAYEVNFDIDTLYSMDISSLDYNYMIIYWGDGTSERAEGKEQVSHEFSAGKYSIRIFGV